MTPHLTLITPTCDRPAGFALAERWMRRQTVQPDDWIVADGGTTPVTCTLGQRHIHHPRPPGVGNFLGNLSAALDGAAGEVLVFIEDDDWYAPTHLEQLLAQLAAAPLALAAGDDDQRYYNVAQRSWRTWKNVGACLCQTAIRQSVVPRLLELIRTCGERASYGVDTNLWRSIPTAHRAIAKTHTVVGIKGLPGRTGLGVGHRPDEKWTADQDGAQLRAWVGADASRYLAGLDEHPLEHERLHAIS